MSKFLKLEIIGFIFVSILGTLFHFAYDFSSQNFIVGIFTATNESTFEHLKLLLYPYLVYSIIEFFILKRTSYEYIDNFICTKTIGLIGGLISIIVLFYTYTGVLGYNIDLINIAIFFISVFLSFFISYKNISKLQKKDNDYQLCLLIVGIIVILFIIFTLKPLDIGLFKEPL